MTGLVFDAQRRRVTIGRWSERSVLVTPPIDLHGTWTAVLEVRRQVNLVVEATQGADMLQATLWAGRPDVSDGLAIVVEEDVAAAVARIPLCSCGDRGCGNAGVQFDASLPAGDLPGLVELVRTLPISPMKPAPGHTCAGGLSE